MSKEMTVIVLGLWVAVVPYLGVPGTWRTALLVLSGIGIAIVGFLLRGESIGRAQHRGTRATFVETLGQETPATHEHAEGITSFN